MNSPKKILVIAGGTYVSGAEKVTLDVIQGFQENGHEVHCMVSGWNDGDFISRLQKLNVPYTAIKLGWYYTTKIWWSVDSLVHYPKAILDFIRLKKKYKPDIIYTISFRQIVLLYPFFGKNIIYHIHDPNSHSKQSKFFLQLINKKVKTYIAVSNFIKLDLIKCGLAENKIEVIYNGIEIKPQPRKQLSEKSIFKVGIVGQVIRRKGHLIAVEALQYLIAENKEVQLVIVGVGDAVFTQEVKQKITELQLNDHVVWKGFVEALEKIYEDVDVVIAPTQNEEPFGLMACEACMFGIPVIVANKGGLVEIVDEGVNGYTFNANNAHELADKISLLYQNKILRTELGNAGKQKVAQLFSKQQMNKNLQLLIEQMRKN
jgi:glycosyltransferase involved in cell wall biosynthesis